MFAVDGTRAKNAARVKAEANTEHELMVSEVAATFLNVDQRCAYDMVV